MGDTGWFITALVAGALVMFLLEIVTPTFGVLAGLGICALGGAVYLCFTVSEAHGMVALVGTVVLVPTYLVLLVKVLPRSPLGRRLFLAKPPTGRAEGTPEAESNRSLLDREGTVETPLRPTGAVRIEGRRVIATAESGWVPRGSTVRVIRAVGSNVTVRQVKSPEGRDERSATKPEEKDPS